MATCFWTLLLVWLTADNSIVRVQAGIGYFWHVTDFHYDANATNQGDRSMCSSSSASSGKPSLHQNDRFGNYRCDSPWRLVQSAVEKMKEITGEEIEFILWTGDSAARWSASGNNAVARVQGAVEAVTLLLKRTFPGTAIYPAVGGADVFPRAQLPPNADSIYDELANLWRFWLPPEAEASFRKGGYYVIDQAGVRLHLVALNTNLYSEVNQVTSGSLDPDPGGQFAWLEGILLRARRRKGTVFIFGHVPPGIYERHYTRQGLHWFQERFNRRYLQLIRNYADVIVGQFYGHAHTDSFRVIYDEAGRPVSWILLSPAVTPREPNLAEGTGPNNPAIRLVKYNTDTGQVLDYAQYYLNLSEANWSGRADWRLAYNFSRMYHLPDVSPFALHSVAQALLSNPYVFHKYYTVNSVMRYDLPPCSALCRQVHFCAVTEVDYEDFEECTTQIVLQSSYAASLASNIGPVILWTTFIVRISWR